MGAAWAQRAPIVVDEGPLVAVSDAPVSKVDKKGGDWQFWPADLRIREYPAAPVAVTS